MTQHERTRRKMSLCRGVFTVAFSPKDSIKPSEEAITTLAGCATLKSGERVLVTKGDFDGQAGGTNSLKILTVP